MKRTGPPAASPNKYVRSLTGWQRDHVETLRSIAQRVAGTDERMKWGHLVYFANGPAFLIRAEEHRVLFGFWRGKRLLDIEPRMTGTGKYEMKTLELRKETPFDPAVIEQLIRKAIELNLSLGNPTTRE